MDRQGIGAPAGSTDGDDFPGPYEHATPCPGCRLLPDGPLDLHGVGHLPTAWMPSIVKAALSAVPGAAVVVRKPWKILAANTAAAAMLAADRDAFLGGLEDALEGHVDGTWNVVPVGRRGATGHYVAVRRFPAADAAPRVAWVSAQLALTKRQSEVLELVVLGHSNKAIASAHRCSESAVEQQVTALLRRFDVESRVELVARFWTEGAP